MHAGLAFGHGLEDSIQFLEVRKAHFRLDERYLSLSPNSARAFIKISETGSVTAENMQHWPNRTQLRQPPTSSLHSFPFQTVTDIRGCLKICHVLGTILYATLLCLRG